MIRISTTIILVVLFVLAYSQGVINFTYANECSETYTKIKKVNVNYTYALVKNTFAQFPSMFIDFQLDQNRKVFIKYHIKYRTEILSYFNTALVIDGEQDKMFLIEHDNAWHHTNSAGNYVYLPKGRHIVQVFYYTGSPIQVNKDWLWPAVLVVQYQSKTP